MKSISERQEIILDFIQDFIDVNDYPPTIRDIQAGCNISSTSVVSYNLDKLHHHRKTLTAVKLVNQF